jgi:hypothetical protein
MTTATLTAPRRSTASTRSSGPRLLLPPVAEPSARATERGPAVVIPPALRSVLSPVTEASWPLAAPVVPAPTRMLPDPDQLCGSLVLAAVEVLAGIRPLVQLTRWVTPAVLEMLADGLRRAAPPGRARSDRAVARTPGRTAPIRRATILRTHLSRVSATAAEASVVVHDGARVRAAALRLEVHRGHWRATVLQIG